MPTYRVRVRNIDPNLYGEESTEDTIEASCPEEAQTMALLANFEDYDWHHQIANVPVEVEDNEPNND